jgi:hypothetical protein
MQLAALLNNGGALVTTGLGALALVRPSAAAAFTSVAPQGLVGVSEIRATYGGFFAALGAAALWSQTPAVFSVVGLAWAGAALGRLLSVVVDRSTSAKNLGGVLFEGAIATLLLVR